jgi:hypothetical protein
MPRTRPPNDILLCIIPLILLDIHFPFFELGASRRGNDINAFLDITLRPPSQHSLAPFFDPELVVQLPHCSHFWMSPSLRSPSLSDLEPLQLHSSDDVQETSFALPYDGRRFLRTRPRRLIAILFVAAVAIITLFSERHLLSEPSLYPGLPDSFQNAAPPNAIRTVEPVVITLIMYSEGAAKEGAILLKVPFLTSVHIETV